MVQNGSPEEDPEICQSKYSHRVRKIMGLMKLSGEKNNWSTGCSIVGFHEKLLYIAQQLISLQEEKPAQGRARKQAEGQRRRGYTGDVRFWNTTFQRFVTDPSQTPSLVIPLLPVQSSACSSILSACRYEFSLPQ